MIYTASVALCDLDFSERGLKATVVGSQVTILPTATVEEVSAVLAYLETATPCVHVLPASGPQIEASDAWAIINAQLAAVPVGADYDALRTRLTSALAAARDRADVLGGLA